MLRMHSSILVLIKILRLSSLHQNSSNRISYTIKYRFVTTQYSNKIMFTYKVPYALYFWSAYKQYTRMQCADGTNSCFTSLMSFISMVSVIYMYIYIIHVRFPLALHIKQIKNEKSARKWKRTIYRLLCINGRWARDDGYAFMLLLQFHLLAAIWMHSWHCILHRENHLFSTKYQKRKDKTNTREK